MKQLSATDSLFVYNESSRTPLHISPLLIYNPPENGEKPVRFTDILERFESRLHRSPVFRQKLSKVALDLDKPYWVEDADFDLEFHVRHMALPKPGDWRQFCILIARLHSRPLDMQRPLWEAYVIEGLDNINGLPKGSFALYMKIHHSAIDGATGNQMIEALHDLSPTAEGDGVPEPWEPASEIGQLNKLSRAYLKLFRVPKQVSKVVKHAIKSRSESVRQLNRVGLAKHAIQQRIEFNASVSPHRVFGGLRIDLAELKVIKNSVSNCTLNDAILSIVGGALRQYLLQKNTLPKESLVVGVPISTRQAADQNTGGGNKVAGMLLNLRTDIADHFERVKAINEDAVSSKVYANAVGIERISTLVDSIPTGLASLSARAMAVTGLTARTPVTHTIVTNVPGPQFPLYFCGAKASLWIGAGCLVDGMGLFHTVNSYNGTVFVSFLSCRQMMPDPEFYHQCINASFKEHLEAAKAQDAKTSTAPQKKKTKKVLEPSPA